jgi:Fe-S cluster assembly iron-binding protein IscA
MAKIEVTDKAKDELLTVLKEQAKEFVRLFIQGVG